MTQHVPKLVGHGHTPGTKTGVFQPHRHELPEDLLREAGLRLAIIALLGAILWIVGPALDHLALRAIPGAPWNVLGVPDLISVVSSAVSLALFLYIRRSKRSPAFILDIGLGYQFLTAAALGLLAHWSVVRANYDLRPVFTWIGVVVMLFAAIVPRSPSKTLIVSILCVAMGPLAMWLAKQRGTWDYGSDINLLVMHYPDFILVGLAVVISHVVTGLGRQVSRARELGSYQVGELLGKGGMGEVYRATHRMLARPAAIKLIRPETIAGGDEAARELAVKRFKREAEVAANLQSPHTVELYDFGVTEDESLYFVMELLEGMDLQSLVDSHGPLPANRVIHILEQVCHSLEEAHARGLVHRDIKPANIHLGRLGLQHDFVKVLDFGLVKSVNTKGGGDTAATEIGMTPGTPDYMAPEMTLGETLDGRTDLYAVGCVGYFLLTGHPVFSATNVYHMIARHLNDAPSPPSADAGAEVPPELDRLILACLAKQPADRPQSAADLRRTLCGIAVEPWGEAQAAAWWSERVTAAAATADSG